MTQAPDIMNGAGPWQLLLAGPQQLLLLAEPLLCSGGHDEDGDDESKEMQWDTPFGVGKFLGMAEANEPSTNPGAPMKAHWCMPFSRASPPQMPMLPGRSCATTQNAILKCHPTKHTQQGNVGVSCLNRCTPCVDSCVARGSVIIAKAKIGSNGKLSKPTRLELRSKGYSTVSVD